LNRAVDSVSRLAVVAVVIAGAALIVTLGACGSDDESDGVTVTATTGIAADITENVAGHDAEVEQIIPDATSPHDFQLSAEDRQRIDESALLVRNGADLEQGIPIGELDVDQFVIADNVGELRPFEEGPGDPHVWMDPTRVERALPALAEALGEADSEHASAYQERAKAYAEELRGVDHEVRTRLATIPPQNRELVTSHDALGYFADRYGFEIVATTFPASGPEAEASAATIRDVEAAIRSADVPTVYAEEEDDPKVLRNIASDTGVEIEEDLLVETPGDAGSYVEMLRRDAELLSQGLAG
jgi:zinc/manganese transport system substrate-binding protein